MCFLLSSPLGLLQAPSRGAQPCSHPEACQSVSQSLTHTTGAQGRSGGHRAATPGPHSPGPPGDCQPCCTRGHPRDPRPAHPGQGSPFPEQPPVLPAPLPATGTYRGSAAPPRAQRRRTDSSARPALAVLHRSVRPTPICPSCTDLSVLHRSVLPAPLRPSCAVLSF